MNGFKDKRSDKRIACQTALSIRISFFNSEQSVKGILVDHCMDGMCFISNHAFYEGAPLLLQVDYHHVDGEVKWCCPYPDEGMPVFRTGIKYY